MNATEACIALNMLPTIGPVRLRKLLEVFKEPQEILRAKRSELRNVEGIGNEVADQIANWESTIDLAGEIDRRFPVCNLVRNLVADSFDVAKLTAFCPEDLLRLLENLQQFT